MTIGDCLTLTKVQPHNSELYTMDVNINFKTILQRILNISHAKHIAHSFYHKHSLNCQICGKVVQFIGQIFESLNSDSAMYRNRRNVQALVLLAL